MDADAAHHDQPGVGLARVVEDLLECLAVEERFGDGNALLGRHPLTHLEMRLINLRQPGVDDLFVQLVLLLEAEDLRRLFRENADDAIEDGIVQIGVIHGDRFDLLAEGARQIDGGHERAKRLWASVDAHEDRVPFHVARVRHVLHHPDIAIALSGDAFTHGADHAVARAPHAERSDHDQIVT